MATPLFAFLTHQNGSLDDSALELVTAARTIFPDASPIAIVTGAGAALDTACTEATASYGEVWRFGAEALEYPNAEVIRPLLLGALPKGGVLLLPHTTFGIDLGPGLAIRLDAAFVPDVVAVDSLHGTTLTVARQEFNGQANSHWACDIAGGAVISLRPGAFAADQSRSGSGRVVDKSGGIVPVAARRRFVELVAAEAGDVDITKEDVLVSVGRGFGDKENLSIAEELAAAMGAALSCSRPLVDARWLDKSRQVGTSGKTVSPKVYLALGISGAFQHLGGLKGNPFIIAVNKNPKAPIFQVASVGVVGDVLELVPALTEKIRKAK